MSIFMYKGSSLLSDSLSVFMYAYPLHLSEPSLSLYSSMYNILNIILVSSVTLPLSYIQKSTPSLFSYTFTWALSWAQCQQGPRQQNHQHPGRGSGIAIRSVSERTKQGKFSLCRGAEQWYFWVLYKVTSFLVNRMPYIPDFSWDLTHKVEWEGRLLLFYL